MGAARQPVERKPAKWPVFIGLLLAAGPSLLLASPRAKSPAIRVIHTLAARDGVRPGEELEVAVRVVLQPGFHVNSHVPSLKYLVPTRLETVSLTEITFGDWTYPEGKRKRFPFADEPLRVYEGGFVIRGSLKIAADTAAGKRTLTTRLHYQACTQDRCYPPRVEQVPLEIRVVPKGEKTRGLHPEIFSSRSR